MSVSAWIQEVFPRILNLESQKFADFANFPGFKLQDSKILAETSGIQAFIRQPFQHFVVKNVPSPVFLFSAHSFAR